MTMLPASSLSDEVTALALCWRLTRTDGVVLGFTSHDQDIQLQGVRFRARPGMTPSAVSLGSTLQADSMDMEGVLNASAITPFDLEAGRWAGARVELLVCDWRDPEAGTLGLMQGSIGNVSVPYPSRDGPFRVELLSDASRLDAMGPLRVAPMCRAELGDIRCGVDMASRRVELQIQAGVEGGVKVVAPPDDVQRFAGGRIRVVSGVLSGIDRGVVEMTGDIIYLEEALPMVDLSGTSLWLWEGCDKRLATCFERFENAAAFDGEPHVPGTDALLRYAEG